MIGDEVTNMAKINPWAILLSGLGAGLDKYGDYAGKMVQAKQLAQMEDQILRQRQAENDARDLANKKAYFEWQIGQYMKPDVLQALHGKAAAGFRQTGLKSAKDRMDELFPNGQ